MGVSSWLSWNPSGFGCLLWGMGWTGAAVSVWYSWHALSFPETASGTISLKSPGSWALGLLSNSSLCTSRNNFAALELWRGAENTSAILFSESKYVCVKWGVSSSPEMIISDWDQWWYLVVSWRLADMNDRKAFIRQTQVMNHCYLLSYPRKKHS